MLSNRKGINSGAAYSPDGTQDRAHDELPRQSRDLHARSRRRTTVTRLTKSFGFDVDPSWSPDGEELAFVSSRTGMPDGLQHERGRHRRDSASPSPAATTPRRPGRRRNNKIGFAGWIDGHFDVFIMNPDGTNIERLTKDQGNNEDPHFSPDGDFVVFSSNRTGSKNIYVMNVDGTFVKTPDLRPGQLRLAEVVRQPPAGDFLGRNDLETAFLQRRSESGGQNEGAAFFGELDELKSECHQLKGSAATYGFEKPSRDRAGQRISSSPRDMPIASQPSSGSSPRWKTRSPGKSSPMRLGDRENSWPIRTASSSSTEPAPPSRARARSSRRCRRPRSAASRLRETIARSDLDPDARRGSLLRHRERRPAEGTQRRARSALRLGPSLARFPARPSIATAPRRRSGRRHHRQDRSPARSTSASPAASSPSARSARSSARKPPTSSRTSPARRPPAQKLCSMLSKFKPSAPRAACARHQGTHDRPHHGPVRRSHGPRVQGRRARSRTSTRSKAITRPRNAWERGFYKTHVVPVATPDGKVVDATPTSAPTRRVEKLSTPAARLLQGRHDHRRQREPADRRRLGRAADDASPRPASSSCSPWA